MHKNIRLLTDDVAEKARPRTDKQTGESRDAFVWDTKLKGYGLIVRKSGLKVWAFQREVQGSTARKLLGHYPAIKEEDARKAAMKAFADMGGGLNPHAARDARMTLDAAFKDYIQTRVDLSPATVSLYEQVYRLYLEKALGKTPVYDLGKNPRSVSAIFAQVTKDKGPGAGNQVAQLVRMIYNRELEAHEGQGWPRNPVRAGRKNKLFQMNKLIPRETIIAEGGFRAWADAVKSIENPIRRAGQLWMLLTGMRVNDVRTMRWEHIAWEPTEDGRRAKDLKIPKPKGGRIRAYRLPLSDAMAAILERLHVYSTEQWAFPGSPWCFPALDSKQQVAHVKEFKEQRREALVNPHSLRRTFATVAADVVPAKHISFLMNHALQKNTTDIYIQTRPESLRRSQQSITDTMMGLLELSLEEMLGPLHSGTKQTYGKLPAWGRKGLILAKKQEKTGRIIPIEGKRKSVA